jgi:hypothetical protein
MTTRDTEVRERRRRISDLMVSALLFERRGGGSGLSQASELDLVILAMSWGVPLKAARGWAKAPGAAGRWTWSVVSMACALGHGIPALAALVRDVEQRVTRKMGSPATPPRVRQREERAKGTERQRRRKQRVRRSPAPKVVIPPPRKRRSTLPVTSPVIVGRTEPRLRGAQLPPRLLDRAPEPQNPNRPAGWTTTDWINSKS